MAFIPSPAIFSTDNKTSAASWLINTRHPTRTKLIIQLHDSKTIAAP
jgi:hypothetical protein